MKIAIGLYALYFLMVAINGNSSKMFASIQTDGPAFLPWIIVAAIIGALYENDATNSLASAFLVLIVITFTVKNWNTISADFTTIYNNATGIHT